MIDEIDKQMFFRSVTRLMEKVPNYRLVDMMAAWRAEPCGIDCNIVNYGSVFIEQNPGIGSLPLYKLATMKLKM